MAYLLSQEYIALKHATNTDGSNLIEG